MNKKTKVISVRVPLIEYEALANQAKERGELAQLIRTRLLAGSATVERRERRQLLARLERVRANLAGIARGLGDSSSRDGFLIAAALVAAERHLEEIANQSAKD